MMVGPQNVRLRNYDAEDDDERAARGLMGNELALTLRLEHAERELAAISTAEDAQQLAEKAAAVAEFARRVKLGNSAINHATTIRLLAERKLALLVDEGQAAGQVATKRSGGRPPKMPSGSEGINKPPILPKPPTLKDLGITNSGRLREARKLARDYTEDDIRDIAQQKTDEDKQMSRDALLKSNARLMRSSETNEWYTPRQYIDAATMVLGAIDLDPASCEAANVTVHATQFYDEDTDGLTQPWKGRVWLNPPYGRVAGDFVAQLWRSYQADHVSAAIALINAHSIDTIWFRPLWDAVLCFTYQRIDFTGETNRPQGSTHGSVFAYLGPEPRKFAEVFAQFGAVMRRWPGDDSPQG